jgi:hypothetical protein
MRKIIALIIVAGIVAAVIGLRAGKKETSGAASPSLDTFPDVTPKANVEADVTVS